MAAPSGCQRASRYASLGTRGRRGLRDGQRPLRRELDEIARREGLAGDRCGLHAVDTVRAVLTGITADCVEHVVSLRCLPQRIRLDAADLAVISQVDAEMVGSSE